jgi:hypothetical protein
MEDKIKNLEGMLRAIQELKSEHYIGTKEAYKYLKESEHAYSNPSQIARIINARVSEKYSLTFPATAEAISGLFRMMSYQRDPYEDEPSNEIEEESNEKSDNEESLSEDFDEKLFDDEPSLLTLMGATGDANGLWGIFWIPNLVIGTGDPRKKVGYFYPLYERANERGVDSIEGFKRESINLYKEEYEKIREDIENFERILDYDALMDAFLYDLERQKWDFSGEDLKKTRKLSKFFSELEISIPEIIERMIKDKVDHRLEYRRGVLCEWLTRSDIKSYEDAIKMLEERIKNGKQHFKEIIGENARDEEENKFRERYEWEDGKDFLEKWDRYGKNLFTKNQKADIFLRRILAADKNFVIRYLQN